MVGDRRSGIEIGIVSHIDIRMLPNFKNAPICETIHIGIPLCLLVHEEFNWEFVASFTVAGPIAELCGRHGGIANQRDMRARIAEPGSSFGMLQ